MLIFRLDGKLLILCPTLLINGFWGRNFENLSPDSESAPPKHHVCQFLVIMDKFQFSGLKLRKLPNYVQHLGSNNVEGVAESSVEVEMSWVEVDGAGWSWVEVDGAGCTV